MDLKMTYSPTGSPDLFTAYSDADHGGNPDNGRSTTGYILKMGSGAVSWMSRLQSIVTLSTTEAEFFAAVSCGQEIFFFRNLLQEFGYKFESPSPLHIDNQSAIATMKNPEHQGRMKHLAIAHFWIRDEVQRGSIKVKYLDTKNMVADLLTKPLPRALVEKHRLSLGLI